MQKYVVFFGCFGFCKVVNLYLGASPAVHKAPSIGEYGLAVGVGFSEGNRAFAGDKFETQLPLQKESFPRSTEPYIYPFFIKAFDNSLTLSVILWTGV